MENLQYLDIVYPFEGKISACKVKLRACDILQDEEDRKVYPEKISLREAVAVCEHYGVATFVWPD